MTVEQGTAGNYVRIELAGSGGRPTLFMTPRWRYGPWPIRASTSYYTIRPDTTRAPPRLTFTTKASSSAA